MRYFENLHPLCILIYFVSAIGLTLACFNPYIELTSCAAAASFLLLISEKKRLKSLLIFLVPMCILITIINPVFNHRGVTNLFILFGQWITLEALLYGLCAALSLASLVLWFGCYSVVMTSDKFMYLVGRVAPATSLLITMTFQEITKLKKQLNDIRDAQKLFEKDKGKKVRTKLVSAVRHTSTLTGWSLENAVEQADSMKARGYGIRRRTSFHLFKFESRDAFFLSLVSAAAAICVFLRIFGYGSMDFYPRMRNLSDGAGNILIFVLFSVLLFLPVILEGREYFKWRSYGLIR